MAHINQRQQLGYELQTCSGTDRESTLKRIYLPYKYKHHENSLSAESFHQYQVARSALTNSVLVGSQRCTAYNKRVALVSRPLVCLGRCYVVRGD